MKQKQILRELKAAFCNSPPSRLQHMTAEALDGFTTTQIEGLIAKLEVTLQFLKNQKTIRENYVQMLEENSALSSVDKRLLTIVTHRGKNHGPLK